MNFRTASHALLELNEAILNREPIVNYADGTTMEGFVLSPGQLTVVGAPPGTGKTALAMQLVFEAMEQHRDVPVVIANAETDMKSLLRREVSRRSQVLLRDLRHAICTDLEIERAQQAVSELVELCPRIAYMEPPFNAGELSILLEGDKQGILVVDYLQMFRLSGVDARSGVDDVVAVICALAKQGWAVLALSATTRNSKDGHDHAKLGLHSFKESGEIEFRSHVAYVLRDVTGEQLNSTRHIEIECLKERDGPAESLKLAFEGRYMRFEKAVPEPHEEFNEYAEHQPESVF
ncbi:MAG: DnaB-like helicase C-terminal domain-containing protein [Planctomycetota bacterium]